jgi:hypothetical protein
LRKIAMTGSSPRVHATTRQSQTIIPSLVSPPPRLPVNPSPLLSSSPRPTNRCCRRSAQPRSPRQRAPRQTGRSLGRCPVIRGHPRRKPLRAWGGSRAPDAADRLLRSAGRPRTCTRTSTSTRAHGRGRLRWRHRAASACPACARASRVYS